MVGVNNECAILGYANQDSDRRFYIEDYQTEVPKVDLNTNVLLMAMMAVVKKQSSNSKAVPEQEEENHVTIWHRVLAHEKSASDITTLV